MGDTPWFLPSQFDSGSLAQCHQCALGKPYFVFRVFRHRVLIVMIFILRAAFRLITSDFSGVVAEHPPLKQKGFIQVLV
jgi:hypothetical protein